jgi:hypothetical protein
MQNPPSAAWTALYRLSSLFGEEIDPLVKRVKEFKDQEASIYPEQEREMYLSVKTTDFKSVYNLVIAELGTQKLPTPNNQKPEGKVKTNVRKNYQTRGQLSAAVVSTQERRLDIPSSLPSAYKPSRTACKSPARLQRRRAMKIGSTPASQTAQSPLSQVVDSPINSSLSRITNSSLPGGIDSSLSQGPITTRGRRASFSDTYSSYKQPLQAARSLSSDGRVRPIDINTLTRSQFRAAYADILQSSQAGLVSSLPRHLKPKRRRSNSGPESSSSEPPPKKVVLDYTGPRARALGIIVDCCVALGYPEAAELTSRFASAGSGFAQQQNSVIDRYYNQLQQLAASFVQDLGAKADSQDIALGIDGS